MKRDQRQRNRHLGGIIPFGFRVGGLVPDAAEQALITHARTLRADGATLRGLLCFNQSSASFCVR